MRCQPRHNTQSGSKGSSIGRGGGHACRLWVAKWDAGGRRSAHPSSSGGCGSCRLAAQSWQVALGALARAQLHDVAALRLAAPFRAPAFRNRSARRPRIAVCRVRRRCARLRESLRCAPQLQRHSGIFCARMGWFVIVNEVCGRSYAGKSGCALTARPSGAGGGAKRARSGCLFPRRAWERALAGPSARGDFAIQAPDFLRHAKRSRDASSASRLSTATRLKRPQARPWTLSDQELVEREDHRKHPESKRIGAPQC